MIAVVFPAAAAPYPSDGPREEGVAVPAALPPVIEPDRSCTETTKAGEPCKGTPGDDGRCAAHKEKPSGGE